jgi:hypothetical protein
VRKLPGDPNYPPGVSSRDIDAQMPEEHGVDEGDTCGRDDCPGAIELFIPGGCTCNSDEHTCSAVEDAYLKCSDCDWKEE